MTKCCKILFLGKNFFLWDTTIEILMEYRQLNNSYSVFWLFFGSNFFLLLLLKKICCLSIWKNKSIQKIEQCNVIYAALNSFRKLWQWIFFLRKKMVNNRVSFRLFCLLLLFFYQILLHFQNLPFFSFKRKSFFVFNICFHTVEYRNT